MKKILLFLLVLPVFYGCGTGSKYYGIKLSGPHPAPGVLLDSVDGPLSLLDFKGKFTFVYFGYTYCPDICPAAMFTLKEVKKSIVPYQNEIAVVMISVDPERDTPEQLAKYLNYFDSSFVGLSGDIETIETIGEPFGLYYEKNQGAGASGYLINHTSTVFLLDRKGNAIFAYTHGVSPEQLTNDILNLIEEEP